MQKTANPQAMGDVTNQGSKGVENGQKGQKDPKEDFSADLQSALKQAEIAVAQTTVPLQAGNSLPVEVKSGDALLGKGKEDQSALSLDPAAMVSGAASTPTAASAAQTAAPAAKEAASGAAVKASKNALKALDSRIQANNATGPNAMSALAGLKPWSKDWVVGNEMSKNPELQTLFGGKQRGQADSLAELSTGVNNKMSGDTFSQQDLMNLESMLKGNQPSSANTEKSSQGSLDPSAALMAGASGNGAEKNQSAQMNLESNDFASKAMKNRSLASDPASASVKPEQQVEKAQMTQKTQKTMTGAEFLNAFQMAQKPTVGEARASLDLNVNGPQLNAKQNDSKLASAGLPSEGIAPLGSSLASGSLKGSKKVNGLESKGLDDSQGFQQNPLLAGMNAPVAQNTAGASTGIAAANLTAIVAKGTMSQDRLSSDTVSQMTNGIRSFGASGNGEMRIHLKPDNLGELHLKVRTNGKDVGIEIQASNEQAKKVLEESLSSLKESLANQSLNLVKTEVAVGMGLGMKDFQSQMGHPGSDMNQSNQHSANLFSENSQKQFGNSQGQYSGSNNGSQTDRELNRAAIAGWSSMTSSSGKPRAASGRLDVMA